MVYIFPSNPEFMKCIQDIPQNIVDECPIEYTKEIVFSQAGSVFFSIPEMYKKYSYIAAFDLDWTLSYNEKHLYPQDPDDIQILPGVRDKLRKLILQGYTLCIFTNQFAKSSAEKAKRVQRVKNFLEKLQLPVYTFISTEKDEYRKPSVGMWELFKKIFNSPINNVYFVGDAMGNVGDFSDSDKLFGEGIGARCLSRGDVFETRGVVHSPHKEFVIFVGMPGSGKSTYYHDNLQTHIRINPDTMKTKKVISEAYTKAFSTNSRIVIDATNPTLEGREVLFELARKSGYTVKVLYFIRSGYGYNKLRETPVPDIAYHIYFKKLVSPTVENTSGEIFYIT